MSRAAAGADPIVGVVLAGGASARMGRDKATLELGGVSLARRAAALLAEAATEVVVADRSQRLVPALASLADASGVAGPAAGILGAAAARPGAALLVLACDLPLVSGELLAALVAAAVDEPGAGWVVPRHEGRLEPLCALYRPAALAALGARAAAGDPAPHRLAAVAGLIVRYLDGAALAACGDPARLFWNVNTPSDLAALDSA